MENVVFVSGCYDIIHGGHIEFFTQAKAIGGKDAYLIVSFASDDVLWHYKNRKSSLPIDHKKRLLESLNVVDEVVIGTSVEEEGIDFRDEFLRIKPNYLVVTEDDEYETPKRNLCESTNTEYVSIPKTLHYEQVSTTDIINWIKAPKEVPLRVDFAGGWLDVPANAHEGAYIVNCAIQPIVSLKNWIYNIKSGLGGSGAYAILSGTDGVKSELDMGVGWQDAAIILETGLCSWRSGALPILEAKVNPDFIAGKMALLWTGIEHFTYKEAGNQRDYSQIIKASIIAHESLISKDIHSLSIAINLSYKAQLDEGMDSLPDSNELGKKYCGGGWGGYALYLFETKSDRDEFCKSENTMEIEPYLKL